MAGDRHLGIESIVLKEASSRSIPCVIPPISISVNPDNFASQKAKKGILFDISNREFKERWPKQCLEAHGGKIVTFYEWWVLEPLSQLGLLPESPWNMGAGLADIYMVGGESDAKRYVGNGLDQNKILVTGDQDFDELHKAYTTKEEITVRLQEKYHFDVNNCLVLVSLPPLYEHKITSWDDHISIVNSICRASTSANSHMLVSLHPKMDRSIYAYLESKYPLKLLEENLSEVIPVADVFIAWHGSSTWIWSVLSEVPTILCDWLNVGVELGTNEVGVVVSKSEAQYRDVIAELVENQAKRSQLVKLSHINKSKFGLFDGNCVSRITSAIKWQVSKKQKAQIH